MPGTVRLHRVFACPPEKLYRAFTEPDAYAAWLPPFGFACTVDKLEPHVGGRFHASFRNFTTGHSHSFGGEYLELVPNERIRHANRFDAGLPGEMMVTVTFRAVSCGTEMQVTQEGIPDVVPEEACYLGWQESLIKLGRLVEPDIRE